MQMIILIGKYLFIPLLANTSREEEMLSAQLFMGFDVALNPLIYWSEGSANIARLSMIKIVF